MMADIETPIPLTWSSDALVTDAMLNKEIRDAMRFLVSGCSCSVLLTTSQSIPNNALTAITWDTQLDDVDGIITTPGSTFTFTRNGIIAIRCFGAFQTSTAGRRELQIGINGTSVCVVGDSSSITNTHVIVIDASIDIPVVAGDTCIISAFQNSTASINLNGSGASQATLGWVGKVEDFTDFDAPALITPKPSSSNPPAPNPTKHVKTYGAQWSRTYDGNDTTTWDDSKYCFQGKYDSNRGNTKSLVGFDWRNIKNDLNGATKISIKLIYYVQHSYYFSGLTSIIGGHNYDNKPSTWSNANVDQNMIHIHADYHKTKIVPLGSSLISGLKSGKYKGIAFGPGPSTSLTYYGYYNGANMSNAPKLELTYWK